MTGKLILGYMHGLDFDLSTVNVCLYPFSNDSSFLAIRMDFAHRYLNVRRIVYMYKLIYKYVSYFIK